MIKGFGKAIKAAGAAYKQEFDKNREIAKNKKQIDMICDVLMIIPKDTDTGKLKEYVEYLIRSYEIAYGLTYEHPYLSVGKNDAQITIDDMDIG
jgi:hypothetical protein